MRSILFANQHPHVAQCLRLTYFQMCGIEKSHVSPFHMRPHIGPYIGGTWVFRNTGETYCYVNKMIVIILWKLYEMTLYEWFSCWMFCGCGKFFRMYFWNRAHHWSHPIPSNSTNFGVSRYYFSYGETVIVGWKVVKGVLKTPNWYRTK